MGSSLTRPMLALFLSWEFLLHIPCWLHFYQGPGSYTSSAGFIFIRGVSLTQPGLASCLCGEFLIHIPCCVQLYAGNFSYAFRAGFFFFLFFFFYLGSFSYSSHAGLIFIGGVSLTHLVLASFLSGEFLLHIPRWLHFYAGSFSYTSRAVFCCYCCCCFYLGIFSYTSHAGFFFFIWGVSLTVTHPVLVSFFLSVAFLLHGSCWFLFLYGEFLLHIPCSFCCCCCCF